MSRSLLIAVYFVEGQYHGEADGFEQSYGWPPSPARLFQALVSAAATGAHIAAEDGRALKWLEELNPPHVSAPAVTRGQPVGLFVPNNDLDVVGGDPGRLPEIRVGKQWRPCYFDASQPVLFAWAFDSDAESADRVCAIAKGLYQLGRGVDMAWAVGEVLPRGEVEARLAAHAGVTRQPGGPGDTAIPRVGTFDSLVRRYDLNRRRQTTVQEGRKLRIEFRQPPKAVFGRTAYDAPPRLLYFDLRNESGGFAGRPLSDAALLVAGFRDAAVHRLSSAVPEQAKQLERLVIGRGADSDDLARRVRLIPIPSVGTQYTDPSFRRLLVEVPPNCPLRVDDLEWAFSEAQARDPRTAEAWPARLVSSDDTSMFRRFTEPSREFKSVTPLALPGAWHRRPVGTSGQPDQRRNEERLARKGVISALRHAGVRTAPVDIRVQREPFHLRGTSSGVFAAGTRFSARGLWHVALTFDHPVVGPLLLGNGRYLGLGLMRPSLQTPSVIAFLIESGLASSTQPWLVSQAARRAMMARVQRQLPRDRKFPEYVSGHKTDGAPMQDGVHRHIAVVADLPRNRILFVAPSHLQRNGVWWRNIRRDHSLLAEALAGMDTLRAGAALRLKLRPAVVDRETDPLFVPATVWESVTEYQATRHTTKLGQEEALKADVLTELHRRGWPAPKSLDVVSVRRGPRDALFGRVRLEFSVAQSGPLVLGRSTHKGGGLFVARLTSNGA